jgi:DNA repair protein RecN (Recombination protein N)
MVMLQSLTIRDVVLIDRLDMAFHGGLTVLTGETGAGKSILLDALGLALGGRAESGLVRRGAVQAVVAAEFQLPPRHPVWPLLAEQGLAADPAEALVLRRTLGADGRSRAFINDQPASVGLLRQAGDLLVEIQGQFETHGLLDPATHRALLDAYGGHGERVAAVAVAWRRWREAAASREDAAERLARARADEEYLRHVLGELDALEPRSGEESELAAARARLMNHEKLLDALNAALAELAGERGGERALHAASRHLERLRDKGGTLLDAAVAAIERAAIETREAVAQVEAALRGLDAGQGGLDKIEERLFALRALARKHSVAVDDLAAVRDAAGRRIAEIDTGDATLARLLGEERDARAAYLAVAEALTAARTKAAAKLDAAVMRELAPVRLEKARVATVLTPLEETQWGEQGRERVHFEVATNPGAAPGPLAKIASGGELSRFMLALKLVLAKASPVPTLVFDEVDSGIGGAVAASVGERLHLLSKTLQVLVVTHSPQVAARGAAHWHVAKQVAAGATLTQVDELGPEARVEEIARMLSGSTVTAEARAAAASLLGASAAPAAPMRKAAE